MSPQHIANRIKDKLPAEKKEATWEALAMEFPWYPMVHWLHAAENVTQQAALEKAGLYANDYLRLHGWLHADKQGDLSPQVEPTEDQTTPILITADTIEETDADEQLQSAAILESTEEKDTDSIPTELKEDKFDVFVDNLHEEAIQEIANDATEIEPENTDEPIAPITGEVNEEKEQADEVPFAAAIESEAISEQSEDYPEEDDTTPASEVPELPAINLSGLSKIMETPVSDSDLLTPVEPYHTVDYFASQGIKVEKILHPDTATHLDKQVKSFTEWLKSMKKLSYQPATAYTDPLVEKKAKSSLQKEDVVTEAMAEVWEKQAHWEEAIQVYKKLMLLHPEKSHYFAARIKDIKAKQ